MHLQRTLVVVVTCVILVSCAGAQELPEPIDLSRAQALTDREWNSTSSWGRAGPIPEIIDGDEESWWWTGIHDLDILPANVFIVLDEPATVGMMEIVIEMNPDPDNRPMRIGNMEIYAGAGDGWAKIGEIRDNAQHPRIVVELTAARVEVLRLRILSRSETYRAFAKINEVRLYPSAEGVEPAALEPAPVPETDAERFVVREALGARPAAPTVAFDPEEGYLGYVRTWFETMSQDGTDRYGGTSSPMFCSILDMERRLHPNLVLPQTMTMSLVPTVTGQRTSDRADYGGNLQHDVMAIMAAHHVSAITGDERYRSIADDYLQYFLDNCTDTPTGLWPWGEHTYWNFFEDSFERTNHHLLCAPLDFYELAYSLSPDAVIGLCDGLINHVTDLETFVFNRHADISEALTDPRPEGLTSLDFANSASRFLRLWSFAYSKTGDGKYLDWCNRLLDHLEWTRIDGDGPLPMLSARSTQPLAHRAAWSNTLLVGLSLLEYAPMLGNTEEGDRFRALGEELVALVADRPLPDPDRRPVFHNGRGMGGEKTHPAQAYRITGSEYFLEAARRMAMPYLLLDEIPADVPMRAQSYGVAINLMLDMHELDGDPMWLDVGERYGQMAIETLYHDGLFRGAPDLWYQDSHLGTATLIYALVRLHVAAEGLDAEVPANVYGF